MAKKRMTKAHLIGGIVGTLAEIHCNSTRGGRCSLETVEQILEGLSLSEHPHLRAALEGAREAVARSRSTQSGHRHHSLATLAHIASK